MKLFGIICIVGLVSACSNSKKRSESQPGQYGLKTAVTPQPLQPDSIAPLGALNYLLVSDLDDTLKVTHAKSLLARTWNALFSQRSFAGMDVLCTEMISSSTIKYLDANPFVVVSGSPELIVKQVNEFFNASAFPAPTRLLLKKVAIGSTDTIEHKRTAFTSLASEVADRFILLGDNGQDDPSIFRRFMIQNPGRTLAAYVRLVNEKPTLDGQIGFYTAFDIAVHEWNAGRLSVNAVNRIAHAILEEEDKKNIFPKYVRCPANANEYQLPVQPSAGQVYQLYLQVRGRLLGLCS